MNASKLFEPNLGHYFPIREIGRGGFGVVEVVRNSAGEEFARKTFSPGPSVPVGSYDQLRTRFKREVQIQAQIEGPGIMPIFDKNLTCAAPWFIMPLAQKTLDQQIKEDLLTGEICIEAVADVLNALESIHDLDFVHRDVNPKNILLLDSGWVLSDFGAVLPPTGHTVVLTRDTAIYTEGYCSPEQRNQFHEVKPTSDIYSFGCVLHDMLGGGRRTPYSQVTGPGKVGLLIEKCTDPDPAKRPTVGKLRKHLLPALYDGFTVESKDPGAEGWMARLESIAEWTPEDFEEFARYFYNLDLKQTAAGHVGHWISSSSTPLLSRISAEVLRTIMERGDGISGKVAEKYCDWVRATEFEFPFADVICNRLTAIFDSGGATEKARAWLALVHLGHSHNRWFVMRCFINRSREGKLPQAVARRIAVELQLEELEWELVRCLNEMKVNREELSSEIKRALDEWGA